MFKAFFISVFAVSAAFAIVGVALAAPKKIAAIKVDQDFRIDGESINVSNIVSDADTKIRAATNALATVAHTGSYTNLINRPVIEFRVCLDDDGTTRYRLFATTPPTDPHN